MPISANKNDMTKTIGLCLMLSMINNMPICVFLAKQEGFLMLQYYNKLASCKKCQNK